MNGGKKLKNFFSVGAYCLFLAVIFSLAAVPVCIKTGTASLNAIIETEKDLALGVVFDGSQTQPYALSALHKGVNRVSLPCPEGNVCYFELRLGTKPGKFVLHDLHLTGKKGRCPNLAGADLSFREAQLAHRGSDSSTYTSQSTWAAVGAPKDFAFSPGKHFSGAAFAVAVSVSLILSCAVAYFVPLAKMRRLLRSVMRRVVADFTAHRLGIRLPLAFGMLLVTLFAASPLYIKFLPMTMHLSITVEKNLTLGVVYNDVYSQPAALISVSKGKNKVSIPCPAGDIAFFDLRLGPVAGTFSVDNLYFSSAGAGSPNLAGALVARDAQLVNQDERSSVYTTTAPWAAVGSGNSFYFDPGKKLRRTRFVVIALASLLLSWFLAGVAISWVKRNRGRMLAGTQGEVIALVALMFIAAPFVAKDLPQGNRWADCALANFPPLLKGGRINSNLGADFDIWYERYIGGLSALADICKNTFSKMPDVIQNESAVAYPDGWFFYKPFSQMLDGRPDAAQLATVTDNLRLLDRFCRDNGINLYVLFCPVKDEIYRHHDKLHSQREALFVPRLVKHLQVQLPDLRVVYPLEEMRAAAANEAVLLHYKTDTLPTDDGAFIINQTLVKRMRQDMQDVQLLPDNARELFGKCQSHLVRIGPDSSFYTGYLHDNVLSLPGETLLGHLYNYYTPPAAFGVHVPAVAGEPMERVSLCDTAKRQAYIIGDSCVEEQVTWLQCSFAKLTKLRADNGDWFNQMRFSRWQERISTDKPDALIICVSSPDTLYQLSSLFTM